MGSRTKRIKRIASAMPIVAELTQHTSDVDNVWWARRADRNASDLLITTPFSVNARGDEPLAESNYRVIRADIERVSAFGTDYRIDLWPGGSIHTLQVRRDDALALRAVEQWVTALQDYPAADDSDVSELEWERDHPGDGYCYRDLREWGDECGCDDKSIYADDENDG